MKAQLTVAKALQNSAKKYPTKTAIVFEERKFSFEEFNLRVNRLANALLALGLAKGDHVAVLLGNCSEIVELLMAAAKTGIVAVPVNFRFVAKEIEYVMNQSNSKALIVGEEYLDEVELAKGNFQSVEHYVAVSARPVRGMRDYEQLLEASSAAEPEIELHEDDPWYIAYTSGTTGFPKGVVASHRSRILPALFMAVEYGLCDTDVQLLVMPLFHSNGSAFAMTGLYLGNTVFIMRHFDAEGVLRAIEEHKLTYASLVPTMFAMILSQPDAIKAKYNVSSMRVLTSSSAPLLTKTKEEILQYFASSQLHEFYGSSEAGIVTNLKPRDQMRKIRCVGQAMFGAQVKLLDEKGEEVPVGQVGELYSLSHCFTEYYRMPEATAQAFKDGWFSAGDMARMDEEGYFYIVDRKKDMIISGGENIYPTEIEEVLSHHPDVRELAVIGIPSPKWGETVHAVIVLRERAGRWQSPPSDRAKSTADDIMEFCQGRLAGYKRPRSIEFVDSLPKNATGKILRRVLREKHWAGHDVKI